MSMIVAPWSAVSVKITRPSSVSLPSPLLPRCLAAVPEPFEQLLVAQRVHRLPETVVAICGELSRGRQFLHRAALPDGVVAIDQLDHLLLEHEEPAVDPG